MTASDADVRRCLPSSIHSICHNMPIPYVVAYILLALYWLAAFDMRAFQVFLGVIFVALVVYTAVVGTHHGWNLLPVFFADMMAMTWPGQFNFDFMGFLLLSGLWVSWRHQFRQVALGWAWLPFLFDGYSTE